MTDLNTLGITRRMSSPENVLAPVVQMPKTALSEAERLITTDMVVPPKPNLLDVNPKELFTTVSELPTKKNVQIFDEWDADHPAARYLRKPSSEHVFNPEKLCMVLGFDKLHEPGENMLVYGPTGSGKSTLIRQYHALMNKPLVTVSVNEDTRIEKLFGRTIFTKEGGQSVMKYVLGPLGIALFLDIPIMIDEAHKLPPGQATGLHALMDGEPIALDGDGGTVLQPGKGFRMFLTGNTSLANDFSRLYRGSKTQDIAFVDRVTFLKVDYPTFEEQKAVLEKSQFGAMLPDETREAMVNTAVSIQKAFIASSRESGTGGMTKTLSVRKLKKWAKQTVLCQPVYKETDVLPIICALDQTLLAACTESETLAVLKIVATHLKFDEGNKSEGTKIDEDQLIRKLAASLMDSKGLDVDLTQEN